MAFLRRSLVALALAGATTAVWGTLIERRAYTLRRYSLPVLAPGARPIRVLHLSDFHLAPWQRDRARFIARLASERPDFIVNTGDNLGHIDGLGLLKDALRPFAGVPGAYIHGSNDYYGPVFKSPLTYFTAHGKIIGHPPTLDIDSQERFFSELGWENVNNTALDLQIAGQRLRLFGVDDPHIGQDNFALMDLALGELASVGDTTRDSSEIVARLALVHAPYQRILSELVDRGADLILAGHTHGGQVAIPGYGPLVTNSDLPRQFAKGVFSWRSSGRTSTVHVSAGLGHSIFAPVRFAVRPEAALITLTERPQNQ